MTEKTLIPELRFPDFSSEWEAKKLKKLVKFKKGKGIPKKELSEFGNKCILYGELYTKYNEIIRKVYSYTELDTKKLRLSKEGDILIPSSGELALDMSLSSALLIDDIALGGDINILRPNKKLINSIFLSYQINSARKLDLARMAEGSSIVHLYNSNLEELDINYPVMNEQKKIGDFFYTIDKKLKLQKERIEELKKIKKSILQQIFDQEIKFKDENGKEYSEWKVKKINEIFDERSIRLKDINNKSEYDELLSVTLYDGIKRQQDLEYSDTSNNDKSNYKIVNKYDIVYNSMRMWQGANGMSNYNGIVSSAYVVLRPLKNINSEFMAYYFKQKKSIYEFYKRSQGMTSDTLTLKYNLIKDINFLIPSIKEQEKTVSFLSLIDKNIELEKQREKRNIEFKKGLMQKMFI